MEKKKVVIALGHRALGNTLPEQKEATKRTAKIIAQLVKEGAEVVISHSNAPQVGMIHMAMNEFGKYHPDYTYAPMSVCSAMSQGYIGYDLQNAIRAELMKEGIYKPVSTILTQVTVDTYDEAFAEPVKVIGRVLNEQEAEEEENKGNYVTKIGDGYRRIVAAPGLSRKKQSQKESSFLYPKNRMQTVKSVSSEHLPLRWHLRSEPEISSVWELLLP